MMKKEQYALSDILRKVKRKHETLSLMSHWLALGHIAWDVGQLFSAENKKVQKYYYKKRAEYVLEYC